MNIYLMKYIRDGFSKSQFQAGGSDEQGVQVLLASQSSSGALPSLGGAQYCSRLAGGLWTGSLESEEEIRCFTPWQTQGSLS
jgi:hypothetical protein